MSSIDQHEKSDKKESVENTAQDILSEEGATLAWDADAERKLRLKIDLRVLPPLIVLFILSYIASQNPSRPEHPLTC